MKRKLKNGKMDPEKAGKLYAEGLTDAEIKDKLNVSLSSVGKWRCSMGFPPNPPRVRTPSAKKWDSMCQLNEDAYAAYVMGITYGQFKARYPQGITYEELQKEARH